MLHVCRSAGTTSPLCAETRRVSCTHGSCAAVVISRATIHPSSRATSKSWVPGRHRERPDDKPGPRAHQQSLLQRGPRGASRPCSPACHAPVRRSIGGQPTGTSSGSVGELSRRTYWPSPFTTSRRPEQKLASTPRPALAFKAWAHLAPLNVVACKPLKWFIDPSIRAF